MNRTLIRTALLLLVWNNSLLAQAPNQISDEERRVFEERLRGLDQQNASPRLADADIFPKACYYPVVYDRNLAPVDTALLQKLGTRYSQRVEKLAERPWLSHHGKVALGYRSRIDGSVHPYGLIVPKSYEPAKPMRLDV